MPTILAPTADVQSKIPHGTVELILEANRLVQLAHQDAYLGIRIHRHNAETMEMFTYHDAAWCTRPDGFFQGGILTLAADSAAHEQQFAKFSVVDWCSRKLRRVARNGPSAEIQSARDGEGELAMSRLALAEMMGKPLDLMNSSGSIKMLPATMITD